MRDKKAIELSLNFIIIILISVVVFSFGIKFIYDLASNANKLRDLTLDDIDKKISSIVCEGSERACIGVDKRTIERGKFDVFGLKILNVLDPPTVPPNSKGQEFKIEVTRPPPPNPTGIKKKDKSGITSDYLTAKYRSPVFIEKNKDENIGIGIEVPASGVESGTYIFNVDIWISIGGTNQKYVSTQKIYVNVQ